jgi:hypothetical protein
MLKTITYAMIGVLCMGRRLRKRSVTDPLVRRPARPHWLASSSKAAVESVCRPPPGARQRATSTPDNQGPSMLKTITYANGTPTP